MDIETKEGTLTNTEDRLFGSSDHGDNKSHSLSINGGS